MAFRHKNMDVLMMKQGHKMGLTGRCASANLLADVWMAGAKTLLMECAVAPCLNLPASPAMHVGPRVHVLHVPKRRTETFLH